MDERGDGRGTFHRIRQPDVERELCGLAYRATEDEQANDVDPLAELLGIIAQLQLQRIEVDQSARRGPKHDDAEEKSKVTEAIRDERLLGGVARRRLLVPETDEQVA